MREKNKLKEMSIAHKFVSNEHAIAQNPKSSGLFRTNINNKKQKQMKKDYYVCVEGMSAKIY